MATENKAANAIGQAYAKPARVGQRRISIGSPIGVLVGKWMPEAEVTSEIESILRSSKSTNADTSFYRFDLGHGDYQWIRYSEIISVGPAKQGPRANDLQAKERNGN